MVYQREEQEAAAQKSRYIGSKGQALDGAGDYTVSPQVKEDRNESELEAASDKLSREVAHLTDVVELLEIRLNSVLRPVMPVEAANATENRYETQRASIIQEQASVLNRSIQHLLYMLDRLEV